MSSSAPSVKFTGYQVAVVAILTFLQFTVVLDFMILSPLGAILMEKLGVSPARFGSVSIACRKRSGSRCGRHERSWRHLSAGVTLRIVQAFQAKPPPLATGPDGIVRVAGSRVSLETLVTAFDAGGTAEEIVQQYPSLDLAAVYAVISYALDHRADIDAYVARRREGARTLQQRVEAHLPPAGIRERLLARPRSAGNG